VTERRSWRVSTNETLSLPHAEPLTILANAFHGVCRDQASDPAKQASEPA